MNSSYGLQKLIVLDQPAEGSILHQMNELRKEIKPENSFCDVTFNIKGRRFPCHKVVLVLASPYFKAMFSSGGRFFEKNACQNITLEDIEPEDLCIEPKGFEKILTAIYTSRFHLNRRNAYFILRASHLFSLTKIFEAVVRHVVEDTDIDYLIETCLFAKKIGQNDLYRKCITAIASDLSNLSKTDAFIEEMTFGVFEEILSHEYVFNKDNNKDDRSLFHVIMKWCDATNCPEERVFLLLNAANMKSGCLSTPMLAKFIVNSYKECGQISRMISSTPIFGRTGEGPSQNQRNSATNFRYNVFLNTVNVETGAKGWAVCQWKNDFFEELDVIKYMNSNVGYRKVKQIGSKLFCFEYDARLNVDVFYYIENDRKTMLNLPSTTFVSRCFDIEVLGSCIYMITKFEELWKYNCETNEWTTLIRGSAGNSSSQNSISSNSQPLNRITNSSPKLTAYEGALYIVGLGEWSTLRIVPNQPVSYKNRIGHSHKTANPAVCCWQNKLVVSGSNHDGNLHSTVSAYDMTAGKWYQLENMNTGRANHSLSYHNGFLYAVENKPMVCNEKYDTKQRKWINFPSLPELCKAIRNQKCIEVATGDVFNCFIK